MQIRALFVPLNHGASILLSKTTVLLSKINIYNRKRTFYYQKSEYNYYSTKNATFELLGSFNKISIHQHRHTLLAMKLLAEITKNSLKPFICKQLIKYLCILMKHNRFFCFTVNNREDGYRLDFF